MNYIIFDLEWNQAADERYVVHEPIDLSGEIVEIGAVKLDDSFQPVDELRVYITPQYYSKLHHRIAALTHLSDRLLREQGLPFPEAYKRFLEWCGEEYAFMTWSTSDLPMLVDNMLLHGMDVSALPDYYDIQRIFGREIMRSDSRCSLEHALEILNERGDAAHDALHDARNTVKVCKHLDLEEYLGEYRSRVFAEQPNGKRYANRREALHDPALLEFSCPWCGEAVKCEDWLTLYGGATMAYGICPEGDEFLVQLSVTSSHRDEYTAKRLIFEMSDDLWDLYMDRKEALHNADV